MIELKIDKNCVEFTFKGSLKYMRIEALSKFYKENNVQESDQRYVLERQIVTWEIWNNLTNPPKIEEKKEKTKIEYDFEEINTITKVKNKKVLEKVKTITSYSERSEDIDFDKRYRPSSSGIGQEAQDFLLDNARDVQISTDDLDIKYWPPVYKGNKLVKLLTTKIDINLEKGLENKIIKLQDKKNKWKSFHYLKTCRCVVLSQLINNFTIIKSEYGYGVVRQEDSKLGDEFGLDCDDYYENKNLMILPIFDSIEKNGEYLTLELDELFYRVDENGIWSYKDMDDNLNYIHLNEGYKSESKIVLEQEYINKKNSRMQDKFFRTCLKFIELIS